MSPGLRTLITNDDGIESDGLHVLAEMAYEHGLDVVVAAPMSEASGSGAGITATEVAGRVLVEERSLPHLRGVPAHAVAATPAFIALIATRGAFGPPPQLVLSGINRGANVGHAVLHSGTVGAALTGTAYGARSVAVSLDVGLESAAPPRWQTAAEIVRRLLPVVTESAELLTVNVNVPDIPHERVRGVRRARLAAFGTVQSVLAERGKDFLRVTVADTRAKLEPDTDAHCIADGYASVTPLRFACEAHDIALSF